VISYFLRKLIFIFAFLLIAIIGYSQNLVTDPGFEASDLTASTSFDYLGELYDWWTANGSPDYHHQLHNGSNLENLNDCPLGNGQLDCGIPYEGQAVLGCYKANGVDGSREWAATELSEPLVDGTCYIVSFWIQNKKDNPNFIAETSNWGVFFSSTPEPGSAYDPNTLDYDLVSSQYLKMDQMLDSNDWRYIEWTFTANYSYSYLYVGYMGNVSDAVENMWSSSSSVGFYVWIDMVSVVPIDEVILDAIEDIELCAEDTAYLSASCNVPYHWSWDNGASTSNDSILMVSPLVTTTYYAYAGDLADCAKIDSVTVEVIECSCLIPIETTFIVEDNTNCPNSGPGNGFIIVSPSNGVEPYFFQWDDPLLQQNAIASDLEGGNYTCVITDTDGCTDTVFASVDQFAIPYLSFNVTPESCAGSMDATIDLTVSNGDAPYSYLWSNSEITEDISGIAAGMYSVTVTDSHNCAYDDSTFIGYAPPVNYEFPLICEASDIVSLNTIGVSNGIWSGPGIVDTDLGLFDPLISGVGEFSILFTSNIDCADNFSMNVVVDALPNVNFNSNILSGCQPLNVVFSVANAGPDALYIWNFGDGNVSTTPIATPFTYQDFGTFDVSLSITDSNNCSNSISYLDYINVFEKPVADFDYTPEELDDVNSTAQFFNTSSAVATDFYWSFGDGASSYIENPVHEFNAPDYYKVKLTVHSDFGCIDTISHYLKYKEVIFLYIPNSFTPNNDGRNDVFLVKATGEIDLFSMKIFDRWGELVFSTTDINQGWVGNSIDGVYYLTSGVYSYVIEYEAWGPSLDEPIGEKFTGTITLLK
jgi:gliding motility-associated-like protein